jgi:hypothetical protein
MQMLKDNYIQFSDSGPNWQLQFSQPTGKIKSYFEETCLAAEMLWAEKSGDLNLLYSGGLDSEYALHVFLHMGMDIKPVIIQLNPGYNYHETQWAFDFCESKGLDPIVIDIDFDHFVKSGMMYNYALGMKSCLYHYAATAYAIDQVEGTIVLGDGEPYVCYKPDTDSWNVEIHESDYCIAKHLGNTNRTGIANFLAYSLEMHLAFLNDQRIIELASNQWPGKLGSNTSKVMVYNRDSNFNITPRWKHHGYEVIEKSEIFNHEAFAQCESLKNKWNGLYSKNYHEHLNQFKEISCMQ